MKNDGMIDAAQVGKMFVVAVDFQWCPPTTEYNNETGKSLPVPGHWTISAKLSDNANDRYNSKQQTMTVSVEHGVGQKLAEVLLPVIVADASRKAQQLADDSKAMLAALGDRAVKCITDMSKEAGNG